MEYPLKKEQEFFSEDPRSEVIKETTDPEEVEAAIELAEEELNKLYAPNKDNAYEESEPSEKGKKPEEDNSEESTEKTEDKGEKQTEEKPSEESSEEEIGENEETTDGQFKVTDEFIEKQPVNDRKLFENFKGKSKAELAKAAANAVALKNPYIKGNKEAIDAVAKKFEQFDDEELIKTFVETQRETGKSDKPSEKPIEPKQVELPTIPDNDPKVQAILNKEVVTRLRKNKKYADMPDDMTSEEYKEWRRDLDDEDPDNNFKSDLAEVRNSVKNELSKVVYAQTNLQNLFNESPEELLPYLTEENLPKLKDLNDNYKTRLQKDAEAEVQFIRDELNKYGITEKDLGVDLSLTTDAEGLPYNETFNKLLFNGDKIDRNILGFVGKVPVLNKGQLAKKFIYENNAALLNHLANKKAQKDKKEIERLREENLNTLGGSKAPGTKDTLTPERIKQTTDTKAVDKVLADLEAKF